MIKNLIFGSNSYSYDVECDICGAGPLEWHGYVVCSIPDATRGGAYWQTRYEACLDCLKAGSASFPGRLRKHAQAIDDNARHKSEKLRQLANAEWSSVPGQTYTDIMCEQERCEQDRRRVDVQRMNDELAKLRANWPEYQFTVKQVAE